MITIAPDRAPVMLRCLSCGAPAADPKATNCGYCRSPLGTRACPACHSRLAGSVSFCPWCGQGAVTPSTTASSLRCPCGDGDLEYRAVPVSTTTTGGALYIAECRSCHGIWVGRDTVERLVATHADDTLMLALLPGIAASEAPLASQRRGLEPVRYRICPECQSTMNRVNFARISGIIVDVCKTHGSWFDVHELPGVLEFVRKGGLDTARRKETEQLSDERRRLSRERQIRTHMDATRGNRRLSFGTERETPATGFFSVLGALFTNS